MVYIFVCSNNFVATLDVPKPRPFRGQVNGMQQEWIVVEVAEVMSPLVRVVNNEV